MKNYFLSFFMVLTLGISFTGNAQSGLGRGANAIAAKVLFIDYGRPNDVDDLKITNGLEINYTRHFNSFLAATIPAKVGVANVFGEKDNVNIISFDALLRLQYFKETARVVPYLVGGVGYVWEKFENSEMQIPLGAGLDIRVGQNSYINVQGEYRMSETENRNNLQLGLGFAYRFGRMDADKDGIVDNLDDCPNVPGVKALNGCPDADGDGITDAEDRCPNDPGRKTTMGCPDTDNDGVADKDDQCPEVAGTLRGCPDTDGDGIADKDDQCPTEKGIADLNGCPDKDGDGIADRFDECPDEAGSPANKGCPIKDRDGDGIADEMDACPDAAGPAATMGCPDRDGDGIADKDDRCPDLAGQYVGCPDTDSDGLVDPDDSCPTVAGPIKNKGCPEVKKEDQDVLNFAMRAVQFETGKATLKAESSQILDQVVDIMERYAGYSLSIAGHTDNVGDDRSNKVLSEERAKACYQYLIAKGVNPNRLNYAGYGESQPVASNKTSEGRRLNRRVEFNLYIK